MLSTNVMGVVEDGGSKGLIIEEFGRLGQREQAGSSVLHEYTCPTGGLAICKSSRTSP